MARLQIRRYIWLIDTIRSANGITYEEINRKWNRSALNEDGKDWPKRTFFQNINDIRDEFDIEITCDRRDNKYYIEEEFSEYGSIRSTLVDALVLNNAVMEMPAMKSRILLSRRFFHENLGIITHAIQQNTVIRFRHLYGDGNGKTMIDDVLEFEPYGLTYAMEWFAVGRVVLDSRVHIFALRYMSEFSNTDKTFIPPEDFDLHFFCKTYSLVETINNQIATKKFSPIIDDGSWFESSRMEEKYY